MSRNKRRHEEGVSLLEVILVLAIVGSLIILSIKQYQIMRSDQELQMIQYNVDSIFLGLAGFYKANCYGQSPTGGGAIKPGDLYVTSSKHPQNPFPVNIQNDLINSGYVTNRILPANIVNTTGSLGTNGYVAQFNQITPANPKNQLRNVCIQNTGSNNAYGSDSSQNCQKNAQIGTIITWQAQVAVQLTSQAAASAPTYLAQLNGDCLSTASGGIVQPCTTSPGTGDYVVWARLPSFARQTSVSDSYEMNPIVNQFTQMYTTYPSGYLINSIGQAPNGDQQYFYCGD